MSIVMLVGLSWVGLLVAVPILGYALGLPWVGDDDDDEKKDK